MRGIPKLVLCTMPLSAIFFLLVGCGGSGTQGQGGQQERTTHHQSANVMLKMHPEGNSGVSGRASFEDTSEGVVVKLEVRNLPKPDAFYLAHIHPGTCAQGETHEHGGVHSEEGHEHGAGGSHEHGESAREHGGAHGEGGRAHEHGGSTHEHGATEIEYPLSLVKSDTEGQGSSTTTLGETSVDKLFSAEPKLINVHEAGSGDPPILSCADLKRAG